MADLMLPEDLVEFLRAGTPLEYDPDDCQAGTITLHTIDQLRLEYFSMVSESPDDPHQDDEGCYLVRGVSLIAECENYSPEGLLLWLPFDKQYGLWDGEHDTLFVFGPDVGWSEIAADMPHYINAEWGEDGSAEVTDLEPWHFHPYNAEQVYGALPYFEEWYEVKWTRRGPRLPGELVRYSYAESIRMRVERDGERREVISQREPPEAKPQWSPPVTVEISAADWEQLEPHLDAGFWNQPEQGPLLPGEPFVWWMIQGFRDGKYRRLFRSFPEGQSEGDPVDTMGRQMAQLAKLRPLPP